MALNIQTELTTVDGIKINNAYARVAVNNAPQGNHLEAYIKVYPSKAFFEANEYARSLKIQDLEEHISFLYDYSVDNKDTLDLSHDKLIEHLAEQGITAEKDLI